MVIANPISDTAFKFLMSDSRIAKFFIETILEQELVEVDLKPQELPYNKPNDQLRLATSIAVFRLDFIATIKTNDNEYKKVLIEIQKARKYSDITRFRNYLGEHYKKTDEINIPDGIKKAVLPIVTIYLLGFKLPEISTSVVKVGRVYLDQINHTVINEKNEFIEKLTHDCFVVQIPRIDGKVQSRLEKLLSVFEQNYFIDEDGMIKDYPYTMEEQPMKHIVDTLHFIGTDPERRSWLATEKEAYRVFYEDLEGLENEVKETKKALEEQELLLRDKEKTIEDTNRTLQEQDKTLREKDKTLQEKDKTLQEIDRTLKEKDKTLQEKDKTLQEKDKTLQEKDKTLQEKDRAIEEKEATNQQLLQELEDLKRKLGL